MTNIEYLRNRMTELEGGRLTGVFHRFCMESDVEGLRKIIKENINISCIKVIPKNPSFLSFIGCDEYFYTTDDLKFNELGREQILKI